MLAIKQLRYFCKIVENGSFLKAASAMDIAQAALSQQIAELEAQMGVELLHRTGRGIRATSAGDILYGEATELLREFDAIPTRVRSGELGVKGHVRLGLIPILGTALAMSVLVAWRNSSPRAALKLVATDSVNLRQQVLAGTVDLALIFEDDLSSTELARLPLFRQRMYLALPPRLAGASGTISQTALAKMPLIMPPTPNVTRLLLDKAMVRLGVSPHVAFEVSDNNSLVSALKEGLGAAVLPTGSLEHIGGVDLPPPVQIEPPLVITASLVSKAGEALSAAGDLLQIALIPQIKAFLAKMPGAEWIGPVS